MATSLHPDIDHLDYHALARGLHWYCVDHHHGWGCRLYAMQCRLGYTPALSERGPSKEDFSRDVYVLLGQGKVEPQHVEQKINALIELDF